MLSDLFQDRGVTPTPLQTSTNSNNSKVTDDSKDSKDVDNQGINSDEATEREIVDILLAADLGNPT